MRCPITYDKIESGRYSNRGLHQLSRRLKGLQILPFTVDEFNKEYIRRAGKLSIQGVQPKLSMRLNVSKQCFELVDSNGRYILKPPNMNYPELPENEDLTMKMAGICGIETPWHGLIWSKGDRLCYAIKRFDRAGRKLRLALEDFAQLSNKKRVTKYNSSMERVVSIIDEYTTFPVIEKIKLFRIIVFNHLSGNEDMHLKNYSLITRDDVIGLSPAYDLLNTSIAIGNPKEEIALPIAGKKKNLRRSHFVKYLAEERMNIPAKKIASVLEDLRSCISEWENLIEKSFLSDSMKESYLELLYQRVRVIFE